MLKVNIDATGSGTVELKGRREDQVNECVYAAELMYRTMRQQHGRAAAEAFLQYIRNLDDAGVFGIEVQE